MMDNGTPLASKVSSILGTAQADSAEPMFTPAALDAMRLADLFDCVAPQEDTLPLDALAGFPSSSAARRSAKADAQRTTASFNGL